MATQLSALDEPPLSLIPRVVVQSACPSDSIPRVGGGVCVSVLRDGRGSGGDVLSRPHSVRVSWTCPQGCSRGGGGGSLE